LAPHAIISESFMGQVVKFPKTYEGPPLSKEDADDALEVVREGYVNDVAEFLDGLLQQHLLVAGFPINNAFLTKDLILIREALRSSMLKFYNIEHPLQRFAHVVFEPNVKVAIMVLNDAGEPTGEKIEIENENDPA
jgi:hypothetical protein